MIIRDNFMGMFWVHMGMFWVHGDVLGSHAVVTVQIMYV